jgi:two-component system NarL family sensor kinase
MPVEFDGKLIGLWLLGRHDPDDHYSQAEIQLLQTLSHYIAIALGHLRQTQRLHALIQSNVSRHETERARLARDLHDQVLNGLAALTIGAGNTSPQLQQALQAYMERLRQMIGELRPPVLDYGLSTGLEGLADELADRAAGSPIVLINVWSDHARYTEEVQQQTYRIVQQAGENALRHAHATTLRIDGRLDQDLIDLTVEDDGIGFPAGERMDMSGLLGQGRYGLAGMLERAALIGAEVRIQSAPGSGTRVRVVWRDKPPEAA